MFINFTNPVGLVTEAVRRVPRRPGHRHLRRAARPVPAGRGSARTARRRALVRLLRDQPPRLAAGVLDRGHDLLPGLLADDERLAGVRGGPAVRRRVAARGRDDPERVPLLLRLREPRRSRRCRPGASGPSSSSSGSGAFYAGDGDEPLASWEAASPSARRPTWRRPGPAAGVDMARWRRSGDRRLRRRRPPDRGCALGDAAAGDDPERGEPLEHAVPRRAGGGRGAVRRRPRRRRAGRDRRRCRWRPRA